MFSPSQRDSVFVTYSMCIHVHFACTTLYVPIHDATLWYMYMYFRAYGILRMQQPPKLSLCVQYIQVVIQVVMNLLLQYILIIDKDNYSDVYSSPLPLFPSPPSPSSLRSSLTRLNGACRVPCDPFSLGKHIHLHVY